MLIQIKNSCTEEELDTITGLAKESGFKTSLVKTHNAHYIICSGKAEFDLRQFGSLPGVKDVHMVEEDCKLVSRLWKVNETEIDLGDGVAISRKDLSIVMGPCSIESEEQVVKISDFLAENNIKIMRGGIFKPRSSPYSFRGMGIDGLKFFSRHCRARGIKIVSEVMQVSQIDAMYDLVDIFQVGTRNAQNFNLLDALGKTDKPVLLKRGMSSTIQEFLASAEYIFSNGNERIILCERGIRTFEKAYRNTLDLNAIPLLKEKSHLPVFSDPSHGVGVRQYVESMSLASVMAGADGVMIEIGEIPERAASDGQQTLSLTEAKQAIIKLKKTYSLKKDFLFLEQ